MVVLSAQKAAKPTVVRNIVTAFVTYTFGFGTTLVAPSCYRQMKNREDFHKANVLSQLLIGAIYVMVCMMAYFGYNSALASPAPSSIYRLMKDDNTNQLLWTGFLIALTTSMSVLISFPLFANVSLRTT